MTIYASDSLRPVAGNEYVPDSMEARGRIKPIPPVGGVRNGLGVLVAAGPASFEWTFAYMNQTEMDWWKALIGYVGSSYTPVLSKRFATTTLPAARLWDISGGLVNYSIAVIDFPTWEAYSNARYANVVVRFTSLFPATA
jgi:hypothetical protein